MSLLENVGYEVKPVLAIDAKATELIFHVHGIGRLTHFDVSYLWMQGEMRTKGCECAESRVRKT